MTRVAIALARAGLLCALAAVAVAAEPAPSGHAERVEYRDPTTAPARGPAHALVTIEVFFVPGPGMPPSLLNVLGLLQQLQNVHPTRIRLVYRILKSGTAVLGPSAALEAQAEGKFFELLAELSRVGAKLKKEDLLELARKVGVDPQRVALAAQFEHYSDILQDNQLRADRLHAGPTPSVLFNARPARVALGMVSVSDLERDYLAAYDRALDKLERGFAIDQLAQAFDDEAMLAVQPVVMSAPSRDDATDRSLLDHPLATPPLELDGLPSLGKVGAAVPIVVLCRPNDTACSNLLRVIEPQTKLYRDDVRVVWAPWFDVGREDAAELTMLGDAALCAESIGSNQGELATSPGWVWVKEMYTQWSHGHGKKLTADKLIDAVGAQLDVDERAMSACRARMASATLRWITAARQSGVPRSNAAVVIGGRIYDGLTDQTLIQALVEAELSPGVLGSMPRWQPGK